MQALIQLCSMKVDLLQTHCVCLSPHPQVIRAEVHYWKVNSSEVFSSKVFPTFISYERSDYYYGLPVHEYPDLIKVTSVVVYHILHSAYLL